MKQVKSIDARIKKSGSHMVLVPFLEKPTVQSAETSGHFAQPMEKQTIESAETSHHFAAVIPTTLPNTDCGSFLVTYSFWETDVFGVFTLICFNLYIWIVTCNT